MIPKRMQVASAHGTAVPRGQEARAAADLPYGRFGRMFACLQPCEVSPAAIDALVTHMHPHPAPGSPVNTTIPAGFTYLGQFVDHDITFDPTPLGSVHDARALVNFRTPRLDLDSVYGAGPVAQPFLYDWKEKDPPGVRLLTGTDDLLRNDQGRAIIGDARNDENVIIAQLHLLFIRFHNAVADDIDVKGDASATVLDRVQTIVRRHYHWIVLHEFLPKIVGADMAADVRRGERRFYSWEEFPFIPIEFSAAAYRFGHSMVRPAYGLKHLPDHDPPAALELFNGLQGFSPLVIRSVEPPLDRTLDWERFFRLPRQPKDQVQFSLAIDASIAPPLFELPDESGDLKELPRRNLMRGAALRLPSGQDVAHVMHEPLLSDEELRLTSLDEGVQQELRTGTPLWYYILCEAKTRAGGQHLGPVGGRIVAEVLVGLLKADPRCYLNEEPTWEPESGDFTMADLVKFAWPRR